MTYKPVTDSPYDPKAKGAGAEEPALDEIFRQALHALSHTLRVSLPAKVVKVNGEQSVDLQPLLQTRNVANEVTDLPVLRSALVLMPIGQDWRIKLPLKEGDLGLAVFCDRSLDVWAVGQGEATDPQDERAHDLTDAFFLPGLTTIPTQTKDGTTDLVLGNGKAVLRLQKNGRLVLSNGDNELVDLMVQTLQAQQKLIDELSAAIVLTSLGPASFAATTLAKLAAVKQEVAAIETKTDTLKGQV